MPANTQWNPQECTKCEKVYYYCDACAELNCSKLFDKDSYGSGTTTVESQLWTEWDGEEYYKEFDSVMISVTCSSCVDDGSDKKSMCFSGGSPLTMLKKSA